MQINNMYEPEISLKGLLFEVLYRWRSILIAAVIGAVLLGSVRYFSYDPEQVNSEEKQYDLDVSKYDANVNAYETGIASYRNLIDATQDYMSKSIFFNLDPATACTEVRTYMVKLLPDESQSTTINLFDPVDNVLAAYANALTDGLDPEQMTALLGTGDKRFIDELVEVSVSVNTNIMQMTVYGSDEAKVAEASAFFDNRMKTECAEMLQSVYPHDLIPVSDKKNVRSDKLVESQQQTMDNLMNYQKAISTAETSLSKLASPTKPAVHKSGAVKMAVVGFMLFGFLMIVFWAVKYLAGERLHECTEMTRRYGLFVFENAEHSRAWRPGKGIDRLIERWEFGKHRKDPAKVGFEALALLKRKLPGDSTLVLVSTRPENTLQRLRDTLADGLREQRTQVICAADCLHKNDVSKLPDEATLLIVEEKHESKIAEINREAELVSVLGAKTIGTIVL